MAAYRAKTGQFDLRVVLIPRVLGTKQDNGEVPETWPESGGQSYSAARETLTAGETIVQGVNNAVGGMKLRIKGRAIPVEAYYRLKVKGTGELFNVVGVSRDGAETVLSVERVRSQSEGQ